MANKLAPYRRPEVFNEVQAWLDNNLLTYQHTMKGAFVAYTQYALDLNRPSIIMGYEDFCRCVYSLGVRDITYDGATQPVYRQLDTWRPSLDRIRRFEVPTR